MGHEDAFLRPSLTPAIASARRPSPEHGATGETRRFLPFANLRPGPQGSTRKPPYPHARPAIDTVSLMLQPSARGRVRFVLVFARL